MAIKVEVFIESIIPAPEGGYDVILTMTDGSNSSINSIQHLEVNLGQRFGDALSSLNQAIVDFAKSYAIDNWRTTFDLGDQVRILNSIDGLLGI